MPAELLADIGHLNEGEADNAGIDVAGYLDDDFVDTVVSVVEQTTSDLTIDNIGPSTSTLTIKGRSVPAGEAIQFSVDGQLEANSPYYLLVTFTTNSSPVRTRNFRYKICVP